MKLRLIAGELKGRTIEVPKKFSAHPMGERIRSALFNSLAGKTEGASVLDAFGGSGACGFEALSRGATSVYIIEKDRSVFRYLNKNIKSLKLDEDPRINISKAPTFTYLKANTELFFDVIICDPPFEVASRELNESSLNTPLGETLDLIASRLKKDGILILNWPDATKLPELKGLSLLKQKTYAGAKLGWYE